MKKADIRTILTLLGVEVPNDQPRTGWMISKCPWGPWRHEGGSSGAGKFGVKLETGDPHANCFSCGWHGTLMALVIEMRNRNKVEPQISVEWVKAMQLIEKAEGEFELANLDGPDIEELLFGTPEEDHVFPDWWMESFVPWRDSYKAIEYLTEGRKQPVPPKVADALDLRWDSQQERVCFPVLDFDERYRGLHGRAINEGVEPRYRMYTQAKRNNPLIWLGEHKVDFDKPIVVVEGPFDYASVYRVYRNVVTPLFANPSVAKLLRMSNALEWYTLLDHGTGGNSGRTKISETLHKDHVVTHLLPPIGKDPADMKLDEVATLLGAHLPLDDFLTC